MAAGFVLAADLGMSRTAAAVARMDARGTVTATAFSLGRSTDSVPTAVFATDDDLLVGEAAERRGLTQPERLIRGFKRRIGDEVPIVVGSRRFTAESLFAHTVRWVVDAVTEREGAQPDAVIVTTPVAWGAYRTDLVLGALDDVLSCPVEVISEPVAAVRHYATTTDAAARTLAVYDLGGGTFDAAVIAVDADRATAVRGAPTGIADLGGTDFDDLVLRHVIAGAGLDAAALGADPSAHVALTTLRRECVDAKEALSFDTEAAVPVLVGGSATTVRITRGEFEQLVDPAIERTVSVLAAALDGAGIDGGRPDAIVLTGGSSRIPRITQVLSERFACPIAVDADPKAVVALGAARVLADHRFARAASPARAIAEASAAATVLAAIGVDGNAADEPSSGATLVGAAAFDALLAPRAVASAGMPMPADADPAARHRRRGRGWWRRGDATAPQDGETSTRGKSVPATVAMAGGSLVLASGFVLLSTTGLGDGTRAVDAQPASFTEWVDVALADSAAAAEPVDVPDQTDTDDGAPAAPDPTPPTATGPVAQ